MWTTVMAEGSVHTELSGWPDEKTGKEFCRMQSCVFVMSKDGERLMPTKRFGRVRHLLRDGKAKIINHRPFTIQLVYEVSTYTQPMELCEDTGYQHIGISLKSEAHEYVSEERILLKDEKQRHDDQRRYRRGRRNRLRYRAMRFSNRKRREGWLAPSLQHKADAHVNEIIRYAAAAPITDIYMELGEFDPAQLKALGKGEPVPEGSDYQHGDLYGQETLRKAVFQRDGYKCCICGRGVEEGAILHVHHALFWKGRHGSQIDELATVCEKCHTSANHKKGGSLWGYEPKRFASLENATFMNIVRWNIYNRVKTQLEDISVHITYGAKTSTERKLLNMEKSHCNDAYCMGNYRPVDRAEQQTFQKVRRNSRILSKFYDARIVDIRDGKIKSGSELGSERTNRRESRSSDKSLRQYRGTKVTKGRVSERTQHYQIRPGDILLWKNAPYKATGVHCNGTRVLLQNKKSVSLKQITIQKHIGGWQFLHA